MKQFWNGTATNNTQTAPGTTRTNFWNGTATNNTQTAPRTTATIATRRTTAAVHSSTVLTAGIATYLVLIIILQQEKNKVLKLYI